MPTSIKHDNFLIDAVKPKPRPPHTSLGYVDGFRFGFGFFIAGLVVAIILGILAWGAVAVLNLR